jgi:hypothetical protein
MKTALTFALFLIVNYNSAFSQSSRIVGIVTEVVGNQMPSPTPQLRAKAKTVVREIYVYELTNEKQTKRENFFYKSITTRLIAKKKTKADGSYRIKLRPGKYSIFVKEKDGLFANQLDGEGNINVVVIEPNKTTTLNLRIDYNAAY